MNDLFNQESAPVVEEQVSEEKKKARSEKIANMKNDLKQTIMEDPDFASKVSTLSDALVMVSSLGYGTSGNIIVDKAASSKENRVLANTSAIVGYRFKNVGTEPINYETEVYSKNEEGKYVGQVVSKVLNPGETVDLSRQYTTQLLCAPEFSFTIANGKLVASSKKNENGSLKEELESYYFSFNSEEHKSVNDDDVKIAIDEDVAGVRTIKPEFVDTFGYLNNPKESKGRGSKGPKFTQQTLAANYIARKLKEAKGM